MLLAARVLLGVARRKIAIEIKPALAHCAHFRFAQQSCKLALTVTVPVAGVVGMNAGRGEQSGTTGRKLSAQGNAALADIQAGAGQHQLADAGTVGARQHRLLAAGKAFVGQVYADVDQLHAGLSSGTRA